LPGKWLATTWKAGSPSLVPRRKRLADNDKPKAATELPCVSMLCYLVLDSFPINGKIFPKVRRKGSRICGQDESTGIPDSAVGEESVKSDFVFRIVYNYTGSYSQSE
jgi:hypothetical protein